MKKLLALTLAFLMVLTAIPAMAESKTVLTVVTWDATKTAYDIAMEEGFEAANPGVDVQYIDLASQDYATQALTSLASSEAYDVYHIKELSDLQNWQAQGYLVPLNDKIAADGVDTTKYAGMEACYAVDGEQYGLPFRSDFWILYYNKDLFDAANLEYPTNDMTWDEYKELALEIADPDAGIYGTHYHTWLSCVANWSVCDGVNTLDDLEYDDLAYFYELYQELEDEKACMSFADLKAAGLHYSGAFANGNIAMMPMGYWYVATLIGYMKDGTADFNWGIVSVPHLDDVEAGSSFGSPTGMCIAASSKQQDLAWKFVNWCCGPEGAVAISATGNHAAYGSDEAAAALSSVDGFPTDDASKAALVVSNLSLEWPVGANPDVKVIVNEEHTNIMTRTVTIEEGIKNMNDRCAPFAK